MHPITAPIKPSDTEALVNLQSALLFLLDKNPFKLSDDEVAGFTKQLNKEMKKQKYGEGTKQLITLIQKKYGIKDDSEMIGQITADKLNELLENLNAPEENGNSFLIKGIISYENGSLFNGAIVKAFNKTLRTETLLGECKTNDTGHYELAFSQKQLVNTEKNNAGLMVAVFLISTDEKPIKTSEIFFNPANVLEINFSIPTDKKEIKPEWILIDETLMPLLESENVKKRKLLPQELNQNDVEFLSKNTGLEINVIMLWATAYKTAKEKDGISAEIFYGWFRTGMSTDLRQLFSNKTSDLIQSVNKAIDTNIISKKNNELIPALKKTVDKYILDRILQPAQKGLPASYGDAIRITTNDLTVDEMETIGNLVFQNLPVNEFKEKLLMQGFNQPKIHSVQRGLALHSFTAGFAPLMNVLENEFTSTEFKLADNLRQLASISKKQWFDIINKTGVPADIQGDDEILKQTDYANSLFKKIENAYPTAVLAASIKQGGWASPGIDKMDAFFTDNPGVELRDNNIYQLYDDNKLIGTDIPVENIAAMQRILKVSPNTDIIKTLIDSGYTSAWGIMNDLDSAIKDVLHKFGEGDINDLRNNIAIANGNINLFIGDLADNKTPVKVLPGTGTATPAVKSTWDALFGSTDYCSCDHCSSVLSPAAYFVDLLRFLDHEYNNTNLLETLLDKRPDLGEIELSCQNTDTTISYLDLVLEILENAVATRQVVITDTNTINKINYDLGNAVLSPELKNLEIIIPDTAKIIGINSSGRKRPHEPYIITWEGYRARVFTLLNLSISFYPQTPSAPLNKDADFHIFPSAYSKLQSTGYPWSLPCNMPAETVNVYLQKAGIKRSKLMQALKIKTTPIFNESSWVYDTIGITNELANKIVTQTSQQDWGFESGNTSWFSTLAKNVDDVLYRSRLSYEELCLLMNIRFINPLILDKPAFEIVLGTEVIDEKNVISCDLSKASIKGADLPGFFNRLHRFVRLWKNIKWPSEKLDASIATLSTDAPAADLLNVNYLHNLARVLYLGEKYSLSIETLQAFIKDPSGNTIGLILNWGTNEVKIFLSTNPLPAISTSTVGSLLQYVEDKLLYTWDTVNKCGQNLSQINYWLTNNDTVPSKYKLTNEDALVFVKKIHTELNAITEVETGIKESDTATDKTEKLNKAQDAAIIVLVSTILDLAEDSTKLLLSDQFGNLKTAAALFRDPGFLNTKEPDLSGVTYPAQLNAVGLFYRVSEIVKALKLTKLELNWLITLGKTSWLTSGSLPDFIKLLELVILRNNFRQSTNIITGYLSSPAVNYKNFMNEKLGWPVDKLSLLQLPGINSPGSFARDFLNLKELFDLLDLYKLSFDNANILAGNDFNIMLPVAKENLAERYRAGNIQDAIDDIQNNLRKRRRDCLSDYLLNSLKLADVNSLYEMFLIDPQMAPCTLTSRIKQAIASVQLFIHRIIAGLEKDGTNKIILSDSKKKQWEWMKLYRVWEANRKVFLYPENWLAPELRIDKSSFFKEFESELLQNEVNAKLATRSITAYADKLDKIAHLNLLAINTDNNGVCYMVGCTYAEPIIYYFRQRSKEGIWTAWKKIDAQLKGEHIAIVPYNNQLFLYWLEFKGSKTDKSEIMVDLAKSIWQDEKWHPKEYVAKDISNTIVTKSDDYAFIINMQGAPTFLLYQNVSTDGLPYGTNATTSGTWAWYEWPFVSVKLLPPFVKEDMQYSATNSLYLRILNNSSSEAMGFKLVNSPIKQLEIPLPSINNSASPDITILKNIIPANPKTILPATTKIFPREENFFLNPDSKGRYFIYKDDIRTYTVKLIESIFHQSYSESVVPKFLFETHYNPFVKNIINGFYSLNAGPLTGLAFEKQDISEEDTAAINRFDDSYHPSNLIGSISVSDIYPKEQMDFTLTESYAIYNWELFFHLPFLAARSLSQNQRFAEARDWLHYLFNPTIDTNSSEADYWNCKPLKDAISNSQNESYLQLAAGNTTMSEEWANAIKDWLANPFQPDVVARRRPLAYNKAVVMSYLDNLIAWGDQLFRKDTIESINEATMLYVLASDILGKRPIEVKQNAITNKFTFNDKRSSFNDVDNILIKIENAIPSVNTNNGRGKGTTVTPTAILPDVYTPFFCIPHNEFLIGYWDTVADRLFKVRNCMNIDGIKRQLPLWDPPIDPAILIKAVSLGIDIADILNELDTPVMPYKYQAMLRNAQELCNEVKSLGAAFLSALEKKDAEEIARIRSTHELDMLDRIRTIKEKQITENETNLEGLRKSRSKSVELLKRYQRLLRKDDIKDPVEGAVIPIENGKITWRSQDPHDEAGKLGLSWFEGEQLVMLDYATSFNVASSTVRMLSSIMHLFPDVEVAGVKFGGTNLGLAASALSDALGIGSSLASHFAQRSSIMGSYERRVEEWTFQCTLAAKEIEQIDKQIVASEIRVDISRQELVNHDKQLENARSIDEWMQSKFTNTELYTWLQGQLFGLYKQAYNMALQMAKKAQSGYNFELGITASFIKPAYWDSLHKGLLAGESLSQDLRRMDSAFLENNTRDFELTKHISLASLNANCLVDLRKDGACDFQIPELLFAMDFPGHFFRRIKSVSISIPCIAGPYTSISSQLTLSKDYIRKDDLNGDNFLNPLNPAGNYRESNAGIKSIATSNAQGDSGMFELNFRDERYLPFEGAGVISEWNLELPTAVRQFDYNTISDVIITIRYTAKNSDKNDFKNAVTDKIKEHINEAVAILNSNKGLYRLLSLKNDFPDLFYAMQSKIPSDTADSKNIKIGTKFFPYFTNSFIINFLGAKFYSKDWMEIIATTPNVTIASANTVSIPYEKINDTWELKLSYLPSFVKSSDDILILLNYTLTKHN